MVDLSTSTLMASQNITAVVLAAGLSTRMGEQNKLLISIDNEPMLRRAVGLMCQCDFKEVIVVLGHEQEKAQSVLDGLNVKCVFNSDYLTGQMTSVQCGLKSVSNPNEGVLISLADQPMLCQNDIEYLIESFSLRADKEIVMPEYRGQRGNPIIISETVRQRIVNDGANLGCRGYIDSHPELVKRVVANTTAFVSDVDTPDEYRAFCETYAAT